MRRKSCRAARFGSMTHARWALGLAITLLGCGSSGPGHVEISGKSPAEAAAIAARSVCTHDARCGHPSITCMGGGSAGGSGSDAAPTMTCTATINPVPYDECYADASADLERLLTCTALSADQINTLETCFDMLAARACVTQAEADAQARAAEMGISPTPDVLPAACAFLAMPPPSC